jgi:hypothetical protein
MRVKPSLSKNILHSFRQLALFRSAEQKSFTNFKLRVSEKGSRTISEKEREERKLDFSVLADFTPEMTVNLTQCFPIITV